ncbi:preprotein translocase subunit SecG [Sulfurivermis fontis]|jgi:preprotein translocase subunit SecG|uniref:preprotein translocase subunit SecG n=1 Tax=Sulfurivermis fontis TaxID=1972068 RepID=UPI000FD7C4F9|nr:preprotein translocase subunit SecG [Sulfurivermis fontis]
MQTLIVIVHVLASLGVIGLVLLQQGKGADAGAAFGSGASATVFGARGSGSFLTRATAILATVFFLTSLSLAYFSGRSAAPASVTEIVAPAAPTAEAPAPAQDKPDLPAPKQ